MLNKKLIAIAIVTLGLGITSNAFGQEFDQRPITNIKSERDAASGLATGIRSKMQPRNATMDLDGQSAGDIKSPRDVASGQATGKRQYEPVKRQNLGDTATHEVGHKQRKRGKN